MTQPSLFSFDAHGGASVPKPPPVDPTAPKHGGNAESAAAFARAAAGRRGIYAEIIAWLAARGDGTCNEFAEATNRTPNEVSGRFTELCRDLRQIERTGVRRDGCAVYRVSKG